MSGRGIGHDDALLEQCALPSARTAPPKRVAALMEPGAVATSIPVYYINAELLHMGFEVLTIPEWDVGVYAGAVAGAMEALGRAA